MRLGIGAVLALVLLLAAGCSGAKEPGPPVIIPSYSDAEERLRMDFSGANTDILTVYVIHQSILRIRGAWNIDGQASVTLRSPSGTGTSIQRSESGNVSDHVWHDQRSPVDGFWTLSVGATGEGNLAFGAYFREAAPINSPGQAPAKASGSPSMAWPTVPMWAWQALAAAGGALVVAVLLVPVLRYRVGKWMFAASLFARTNRDQVLDNGRRERIYRRICAGDGPSFSDLRRELELANGALLHHLRVLEMQGFVKPHRDGVRVRFFVRGPAPTPTPYTTRTQESFLSAVRQTPGATQGDLARSLGLSRSSVYYHARELSQRGQLRLVTDGGYVRHFPPEGPTPTPPYTGAPTSS